MQKLISIIIFGGVACLMAAHVGLAAEDMSDIAVQAAQQYAGITLNVSWEAGLQAQDPLLFSGPLWEKLTGIKINVIPLGTQELYPVPETEYLKHSGKFDVLNVPPSTLPDFVNLGALGPLDAYVEKYGYQEELNDIAPVYRNNWMSWHGKIYGIPDDGDIFVLYYRKDLFEDPAKPTGNGSCWSWRPGPCSDLQARPAQKVRSRLSASGLTTPIWMRNCNAQFSSDLRRPALWPAAHDHCVSDFPKTLHPLRNGRGSQGVTTSGLPHHPITTRRARRRMGPIPILKPDFFPFDNRPLAVILAFSSSVCTRF